MLNWTPEDDRAAMQQGWSLLVTSESGEPHQLQRIDCPEEGTLNIFESDERAWEHVWRKARLHGSPLEAKALAFLVEHAPEEYQRIAAHCMRRAPISATTNITPEMQATFNALLHDAGDRGFALFSCFYEGQPTSAIVRVSESGGEVIMEPVYVALTDAMKAKIADHDGRTPA